VPGICASRVARETERTRKARTMTATVASMDGIISQRRWPNVPDPV
jgi:hypothetical protein